MSDLLHTVTVEIGPYGHLRLAFQCIADPASDPFCHMVCPESSCEEGCMYPDEHPKENQGECMVCLWLDNSDAEECIDGKSTEVTLPISYTWHGEGVDWKFAPQKRRKP